MSTKIAPVLERIILAQLRESASKQAGMQCDISDPEVDICDAVAQCLQKYADCFFVVSDKAERAKVVLYSGHELRPLLCSVYESLDNVSIYSYAGALTFSVDRSVDERHLEVTLIATNRLVEDLGLIAHRYDVAIVEPLTIRRPQD